MADEKLLKKLKNKKKSMEYKSDSEESEKSNLSDEEKVLPKNKNENQSVYRKRLIVGEADFSYSKALVNKHGNKGHAFFSSIVATEYENKESLEKTYDKFSEHIKALEENGVIVELGVDAQTLHQNPNFANQRFKRIHFNCPHDKSKFQAQTLPPIIKNFFLSASHLQQAGDEIHMALPKAKDVEREKFRQAYIYHIYNAAAEAGYILLAKHEFGPERYPGYEHRITGVDNSADVTDELKEYIFVKTNKPVAEIHTISPYRSKGVKDYTQPDKSITVYRKALPQMDTDEESSEYEDSGLEVEDDFQSFLLEKSKQDMASFAKNYGHILTIDEIEACCSTKSLMKDFVSNLNFEKMSKGRLEEIAYLYVNKEYDDDIAEIVAPIIEELHNRGDDSMAETYGNKQKEYELLQNDIAQLKVNQSEDPKSDEKDSQHSSSEESDNEENQIFSNRKSNKK